MNSTPWGYSFHTDIFNKTSQDERIQNGKCRNLIAAEELFDALCADYITVLYCDLKSDRILPIKLSEGSHSAVILEELPEAERQSYSAWLKYYTGHFVLEEYTETFSGSLDAENVMKLLADRNKLMFRFSTIGSRSGYRYFELKAVRLKSEPEEFKMVLGIYPIDGIVEAEKAKQNKLSEALELANLNNEIISAISKIYWSIYRIDVTEGTYEEVSSSEELHRLTGRSGKIAEEFKEARRRLIAPEYRSMMEAFMDCTTLPERLKDKETVTAEYQSTTGHWHQARFIVKKRNAEGDVTNVLYAVTIIDENKQKELEYQQELRDALTKAKRANNAKSAFLFNMSHDIRTPMNAIMGFTELLKSSLPDKKQAENYIAKIENSSSYMLALLNDVLEMARIESGKSTVDENVIDVQKFNDSIFCVFENDMRRKGIEFIRSCHSEHRHIYADEVKLKEILLNIISNAYKYTLSGGTVTFSVEEQPGDTPEQSWFETTVSDTGIGMSREFLDNIFESFTRERTATESGQKGTGLGMAITKSLVELMGGSIEVSSEQGRGTTFTVRLPHRIAPDDMGDSCIAADEYDNTVFEGRHILLAEDNELNAEIAVYILKSLGIEVDRAADGVECIGLLESKPSDHYNLILMDVQMPNMDGYKATELIRHMDDEAFRHIPIVAMTANAFAEDKERARQAGMNGHMAKPINVDIMRRTIAEALEKK